MQSIAVLDLKTNQLSDYADQRFGEEVHQSYFLGLVFSSDGKHADEQRMRLLAPVFERWAVDVVFAGHK